MIICQPNISNIIGGRLDPMFYNPKYWKIIMSIKSISHQSLGSIAQFATETWNQRDFFEESFPYIEIGAVDTLTGKIINIENVPKKEAPSRAKKIVRQGDIIVSTTRPNRGAISYLTDIDGYCIASTGFAVIRDININDISKEYLYIVLRLSCSLEQMIQRSSGGNYPAITEDELKKIVIPIPSKLRQEAIITLYNKALNIKLQKDKEAKELLGSIDDYLLEALSINPSQEVSSESVFTKRISEMIGNRLDVSFYKDRFEMVSGIYPNKRLSSIVDIDPMIRFTGLADDTPISFIPMECIDDTFGEIKEQRETTIAQTKGYTKFEENDLLWAKITPCMQNGKSAIARNLANGVGCGSTEYYVIRPKTADLIIDYVYLLLRHHAVLKAAQNSFGGSAGQQRVSSQYMKSIVIPHPPIDVQKSIIETVTHKKERAKQLQNEGSNVLEEAKTTIEKMILG